MPGRISRKGGIGRGLLGILLCLFRAAGDGGRIRRLRRLYGLIVSREAAKTQRKIQLTTDTDEGKKKIEDGVKMS